MLSLLNKLLQLSWFSNFIKFLMLCVLVVLIKTGFSAYSSDSGFLKELRNTNIGNLIVWSYWWPAIIFLSIFFGRFWCMVCPVEIITSAFAKIGLKLKRPKFVISGWIITIFYLIILFVGIEILTIHRNPFYMAWYLISIILVSIITGLIFEKNTFCRYVCPVGYLLGIYSRLSFLGWRIKDKNICIACTDKSCIHKNFRYDLNSKSCGVDLYPAEISNNSDCILCAGCMKSCNINQTVKTADRPNPQLQFIGFFKDILNVRPLAMAEIVFILIVSGFVISEILTEWETAGAILDYVPELITKTFHFENKILVSLIHSCIVFLIFPFVIWVIPFVIARLFKVSISLKKYLLYYGSAFIPVIAAAHLCKALLKTTSRLPYFDFVFSDINGMATATGILNKSIILQQNPRWMDIFITINALFLFICGILLSTLIVKKINQSLSYRNTESKVFYLIPLIYGGIFFAFSIFWRFFS